MLFRSIRIPSDLGTRMDRRHEPLRVLIAEKAGSIDAYCAVVDTPYVNSENSLMLMETAILRLVPDISLAGLGQFLHVTRIAGLALFVLLLMTLGASLALGLATMLLGLMRLQALPEYVYSNYPFFFVMVLVLVAVHTFAVRYQWTTRPAGVAIYGIGAGVLTAFVANMRTTYLPIAALFFLCVLLGGLRPHGRVMGWSRRGVRTPRARRVFRGRLRGVPDRADHAHAARRRPLQCLASVRASAGPGPGRARERLQSRSGDSLGGRSGAADCGTHRSRRAVSGPALQRRPAELLLLALADTDEGDGQRLLPEVLGRRC